MCIFLQSQIVFRPYQGISSSILDAFCSLVIVTVVIQTAFIIVEIAQLGERQTEDLKVPGLYSEISHEF